MTVAEPEGGRALDRRSMAAYVAFFLSGASSLIFQTIWTRIKGRLSYFLISVLDYTKGFGHTDLVTC